MTMNDHDFDTRLRGHHAQALANVSARTQAQLQVGRRPAAMPERHSSIRAFAWPLAAACAAAVLVIGMQWRQADTSIPASAVAASPDTASATAKAADDEFDAYTALDETPDLYLWLASSDATTLAME